MKRRDRTAKVNKILLSPPDVMLLNLRSGMNIEFRGKKYKVTNKEMCLSKVGPRRKINVILLVNKRVEIHIQVKRNLSQG